MNFERLLTAPLLVAAVILTAASLCSVPVVTAQQQRSAHSKKTTEFHYVCPMHENITSNKRGTCPKCKMILVKKRLPKVPDER